jgi:regulator of sigma E protease
LAGENDPTEQGSLAMRSPFVRLFILFSGSGVNLVLPVILFTIFFMIPQQVIATDVVVLEVASRSPSDIAGIHRGDIIQSIDGREIANSSELRESIQSRLGAQSRWILEREGVPYETELELRTNPPAGQGAAGIWLADSRIRVVGLSPLGEKNSLLHGDQIVLLEGKGVIDPEEVHKRAGSSVVGFRQATIEMTVLRDGILKELVIGISDFRQSNFELSTLPVIDRSESLLQAIPSGFKQTKDVALMFKNEISSWIGGSRPEISGPIGIARATGDVARMGMSSLIFWTALLSMNLGIINLLPIPALDGGRIALVLLELLRRGKSISADKERLLHLAGFAVLLALIVAISFNDIRRLLMGASVAEG